MKNNLPPAERRQFGRRKSCLHGWVLVSGRPRIPCVVCNISETGALLEIERPRALPYSFRLVLDTVGIEIDCEMKHILESAIGVSFAGNPLSGTSGTAMSIADLLQTMTGQLKSAP